jgi:hypothetical protein
MDARVIEEYVGLRRELEIGLRLAPTRASAAPAAKAISSYLDADDHVAVRLAGLSATDSRVYITLAICLGTVDEIKAADPTSRSAVHLISRVVEQLACYDPSFVTVPGAGSAESRLALHVLARTARGESTGLEAVGALATVA